MLDKIISNFIKFENGSIIKDSRKISDLNLNEYKIFINTAIKRIMDRL